MYLRSSLLRGERDGAGRERRRFGGRNRTGV